MKAKKAANHPAQASVANNGIAKKNKKKKGKSVAHKLSARSEVTEAVVTAAAAAATSLSPNNNKAKKKKNKKNKKNNPQEPGNSTTNNLSLNTHVDTPLNGASPHTKQEAQKKNEAPAGNTGTGTTSEPPRPAGGAKKNKKGTKRSQANKELPRTPENNKENEQRTIFVGNVNTKTTRKSLARFFSKYGKVEAVRLRCAAVPTPGTTKRDAVIMNNFHEKRTSLSAYVRFTEAAMVEAALKANGAELDQKHLQVDHSQGTTEKNRKLAVFIGNLAFEAEEEALRSHFAGCGEIESVRIVRDKKMASGKGFGYINFTSEDAVEMALQMDGQVFMHRQLRVQRCTKQNKKGLKPGFKTGGKKGLSFMKTKPQAKSSKKQQTFSGKKMMETKKFKKMKTKAKFTKEDRKKKAIAHKLAGVKPKKMTS